MSALAAESQQSLEDSLASLTMTLPPKIPASASDCLVSSPPNSENDRLGKLPMEMKVALLASMPDLETLRTVTLTVPGFYLAYKNRQRHILWHVMSNDLSPEMLGEACSLHAAGLIKRDQPGWETASAEFIIAYEVDRTLGVNLYDQTVGVLREIALYHLAIQKVAWEQAKWSISNRPDLFETPHLRVAPLSLTEQTRFCRAFYHYEIFSVLFGKTPTPPLPGNFDLRLLYFTRVSALLDSYDEWEVEEFNCVRHFVHSYYRGLLQRHADGLGVKFGSSIHENVERVITATPFRRYLFQYEAAWFTDAANHCTGLGFGFLNKMMNAKTDEEELHLLKTEAWFSAMINYIRGIDNGWPRLDQRISWFPHREVATTFRGEDFGPNIGIEWARSTYYNIRTFRNVGATEGWSAWLLSWGYAMWDSERLDKWGILRSDHSNFNGMVTAYGKKSRRGGMRT